MTRTIPLLFNVLNDPDALLFVGSGASLWSGLPTWRRLVSALIERVRSKGGPIDFAERELANNDFLTAADAAISHLSQNEIADVLRVDLRFASARPHRIHELLTRLGPKRFVTTNFDKLIEQQLGLDGRLGEFRVVTNTRLAELADIQKASADKFIFKPHGDIDDAGSLVLSRTQYETVLRQRNSNVLRVLETLFVSRPVLFIGFGHRDPDLQLLLNSLKETYLGNVNQLWSIMPDVDDEEARYLKGRYQLNVYSYHSRPKATTGEKDHTPLIELLEQLASRSVVTSTPARPKSTRRRGTRNIDWHSALDLFALARYGARLAQLQPSQGLPVKCYLDPFRDSVLPEATSPFRESGLSAILGQYPGSCIISGPAGSGKSFAFRSLLAQRGLLVRDWCLSEKRDAPPPEVPILLDARMYDGAFASLATDTISPNVDLSALGAMCPIALLVDSVDEMPAEHLSGAKWLEDIRHFSEQFPKHRLIFGTRRSDLVPAKQLPVFHVAGLSDDEIIDGLTNANVSTNEYSQDLLDVLRTPFSLNLAIRFLPVGLTNVSPATLFDAFVQASVTEAAPQSYSVDSIVSTLQRLAFESNYTGRDTILMRDVGEAFKAVTALKFTSYPRLIDRLVAAGIFVSEVEGRIRFVHRAIMEFLAGRELVVRYHANSLDFNAILNSRRWDNAIAWSAALLPQNRMAELTKTIWSWDPALALRIARNAEISRGTLLNLVLDLIAEHAEEFDVHSPIGDEIDHTKFDLDSLDALRRLAEKESEIRGHAIAAILQGADASEVKVWIAKACSGELSFNTANDMGEELGRRISTELFDFFIDALLHAPLASRYDANGADDHYQTTLYHNISCIIAGIPDQLLDRLLTWSESKPARIRSAICSALENRRRFKDFGYLTRQWEAGIEGAEFALHLRWRSSDVSHLAKFRPSRRRIGVLQRHIASRSQAEFRWNAELAITLCRASHAWRKAIDEASQTASDPFIVSAFQLMVPQRQRSATARLLRTLSKTTINPTEDQLLLLQILQSQHLAANRDIVIALLLNGNIRFIDRITSELLYFLSGPIFSLSIDEIDEFIDRLMDLKAKGPLFVFRIGAFLAKHASPEGRTHIVRRANDAKDLAQRTILGYVVLNVPNFTTRDLLDDSALTFVDVFCNEEGIDRWINASDFSTEDFVTKVVMPYAMQNERVTRIRIGIEVLLDHAGRQHGRRYRAPWQ